MRARSRRVFHGSPKLQPWIAHAYTVYFCIIAAVFAAIVPLATSAVIRRQMGVIRETTGSGSVGYRVIADDSGLHIDNTDTNGHVDIPYAQVRKAHVMKEAVVVVTNARQMIPMFPSESVSVTDISCHLSDKGIPVSWHIQSDTSENRIADI